MSRFNGTWDYRDESEWITVRSKMWAVYVGGVMCALVVLASILLAVLIAPEVLLANLFVAFVAPFVCFGYSEFAEQYHRTRFERAANHVSEKQQKAKEDEMSLAEAERIVATFGKGK